MKKLFTLMVVLLAFALNAGAYDFVVENSDGVKIYYSYSNEDVIVTSGDEKYSGDIVIPSTVEYNEQTFTVIGIGNSAFYNCDNLTSITLPESVTSIGDFSFSDCSNLTSISLPEGVVSIGDYAFYYSSNLTSITLPESVESIGESAFSGCYRLTSITLPEGVTSIGDYAFSGCYDLTSITLPEGVTSIGESAFSGCSKLDRFVMSGTNEYYEVSEDGNLLIRKGENNSKEVISFAPYNLTNYDIPEGITSIGESAFSYCSNLSSITLPESITSIGERAFYYCSNLTSISLPEGITSIGIAAFSYCKNLDRFVMTEANEHFEVSEDGNLLIRKGENNSKELIAFAPYNFTNYDIPEGITSIGDYAFSYCYDLTSITLPEGVESIGDYAFYYCYDLTSITLPEGVESIGDSAFFSCSNLTSITLPEGITSIGYSAFYGCDNLTSITLPKGVESIGNDAFAYCDNLTSITLPEEGITSIRNYVVNGCDNLSVIYSYATTPPSVSWGTFYGITTSNVKLRVPALAIDAYKTADKWKDFNISAIQDVMYNVQVASNNELYGTVAISGDGRFASGETAVATATPNEGYSFSHWTENGKTVSPSQEYSFMVSGDRTLVANFEVYYDKNNHLTLYAPEVLTSQDVPVEIGLENNTMNLTAIQFDIVIPDAQESWYFDLTNLYLSDRFTNAHSVFMDRIEQDKWRVIIYSSQNTVIDGNTGTIVTLNTPSGYMTAGTHTVSIENVMLSDVNSVDRHTGPLPTLDINVYDLLLGDADGNGSVNVNDVTQSIYYILGNEPTSFYFAAADVIIDRAINVLDVTGIVSIILGNNRGGCDCPEQYAYYYVENGILYLETPVDIAGIQFDYSNMYADIRTIGTLPGFEYGCANGRFIIYSTDGSTIKAGKHALLRVGDNTLYNMVIADANACEVKAVEEMLSTEDMTIDNIEMPYPNPFHDMVNIPLNVNENVKDVKLIVTNITGQTIDVVEIDNHCEDYVYTAPSDMKAGIYQLTLRVDGCDMKTVKIVKY